MPRFSSFQDYFKCITTWNYEIFKGIFKVDLKFV